MGEPGPELREPMRSNRGMTSIWATTVLSVFLAALAPQAAGQGHIEGTVTAERATDMGHDGYWKYCLNVDWNLTEFGNRGVSHIDVILGLEACPSVCNSGYFAFKDTAGVGPGIVGEDSCMLYWQGLFECHGDPGTPEGVPNIKFEYSEGLCEPSAAGTAYLCFYSIAPPTPPDTFPSAIAAKFGRAWTSGDLIGVLPVCDPNYVSNRMSTWGNVKALFR
jgi:hypothetical protein